MTDPVATPALPNKPELTVAQVEHDIDSGGSPPGAGGWVPSKYTVYAIGGMGVTFGALAPTLPSMVGDKLGVILGGACGAIGGGLVYFATKSAGNREVSK